jgi:iron complex transport system substrate-binding protein
VKICSFVPGATEVIAALGFADQLVGISHECDFPASIRHVPVMIEPMVGQDWTDSATIDRQVKELVSTQQPLYRLDEAAFRSAQPDLILLQDLCQVCAVTPRELTTAIQSLPHRPDLLTLSPSTLADIVTDVERIAAAIGRPTEGRAFADSLRHRLDVVRTRTFKDETRPRVLCLEWLDPLYIAGHWVPEMVELAGGHDVLGKQQRPSHEITWTQATEAKPDIVLVMPCGYSISRTIDELQRPGPVHEAWQQACEQWPQIYLVDAASYFSRPGPRLVDGVELLASILHPDPGHPVDNANAIKLDSATLAMDATA